MTTEPNLLSADGIPLRFGVTLKADSCATGHANIVVKTPGNDNQGWAITALPNPFAIGYARAINDIVGKVLPRETANPNFCPEAVCTNTENMGNQTVSIDQASKIKINYLPFKLPTFLMKKTVFIVRNHSKQPITLKSRLSQI